MPPPLAIRRPGGDNRAMGELAGNLALLRRVAWLSALGPRALEDLARSCRRRDVRRGQALADRGDAGDLYLLITGALEVVRVASDGRRVVFRRLVPGDVVGVSLLGGAVHSADVVATESGSVLQLPRELVRETLLREPEAALRALGRLGEWLGETSDSVEAERTSPLPVRLRTTLSGLGDGRREVRMTHEELASLLGVTRESVSRELKALERSGMIRLRRGRIELLAPR